jgi:hypothetical protein
MSKSETRMTNDEFRKTGGFRSVFTIRHSSFFILHS